MDIKSVIEDSVIDLSNIDWDKMTPKEYYLLERRIQDAIKKRKKELRRTERNTGKHVIVSIYGKLYRITQKDYKLLKTNPEKNKAYIISVYEPLQDATY